MSDDVDPAPDPWAGDVPARQSAPPVWTRRSAIEDEAPPTPDHEPTPSGVLDMDEPPVRGRRLLIPAVIAVVVALGAAVVIANLDDGDGGGSRDEAGETTAAADRTTVPRTTTPPTTVADSEPDSSGAGAPALNGGWTRSRNTLPAVARAVTEPTEVVTLDNAGVLHTLHLPSGLERSLDLDLDGGGEIAVGERLIAVRSWNDDRSIILVAPDEAPMIVDIPGPPQTVTARPGTDEFRVLVADQLGGLSVVLVTPDGRVRGLPDGQLGPEPWLAVFSPSAELLVPDAGGVYAVDLDGAARRVSSGQVVGVGPNHVAFRECDETRVCSVVVADAAGTRRAVPVSADVLSGWNRFGVGRLDPTGSFAVWMDYESPGPTTHVTDLTTGADDQLDRTANDFGLPPVWTADGAGIVLATGDELRYVDRDGDDAVLVEGRPVAALASRPAQRGVAATDRPSVATGLSLVGLGTTGGVYDIDVDAGLIVRHDSPSLGSSAPAFVAVDTDGTVVVASFDFVDGFVLDRTTGEWSDTDDDALSGPVYPGPDEGTVWVAAVDGGGYASAAAYELRDLAGAPLGPTVDVADAEVIGADGAGALLLRAAGGVYVASGDTRQRVTTGEVLAVGPSAAVVRECDEALVCAVWQIDRRTGDRTQVVNPAILTASPDRGTVGVTGSTVSPDGTVVIVRSELGGDESWNIVDTLIDRSTSIPAVSAATPVVWSDDSMSAVYLSGGHLRLFDRRTGEVIDLSETFEVPPLRAVTRD